MVETVETREGRLTQWVSDSTMRQLRMWPLQSEVSGLNPSSAAYRSGSWADRIVSSSLVTSAVKGQTELPTGWMEGFAENMG